MSEGYDKWVVDMNAELAGKRILGVRLMTNDEAEVSGWYSRAVVLELEGGVAIWASCDDEGNDAGAIFTTIDGLTTIPVFGMEKE